MKILRTQLDDVLLIEPAAYADDRGWFMESFNERRFENDVAALGRPVPRRFVQDNHSVSRKGVLRGLHYQIGPHVQGKLLRVVRGAIYDVAVDIRRASAGFGRWTAVELSADNRRQLWVPEGHAHGFLALSDDTQVLYKTTDYYAPESERSIAWNDPTLSVRWPANADEVVLNAKDAAAPAFAGNPDLL
ncbi:MAG: dTDP-4-dehydrorhamnose 3,5-epimerase [Proteobacteria bacterium]|nr:dTDP-4-dehydrorhamnose 3,5-epimerase [Pseudomonadota bacterium]